MFSPPLVAPLSSPLAGMSSRLLEEVLPEELLQYIQSNKTTKGDELIYSVVDSSDPLLYDDGSSYIGPLFTSELPSGAEDMTDLDKWIASNHTVVESGLLGGRVAYLVESVTGINIWYKVTPKNVTIPADTPLSLSFILERGSLDTYLVRGSTISLSGSITIDFVSGTATPTDGTDITYSAVTMLRLSDDVALVQYTLTSLAGGILSTLTGVSMATATVGHYYKISSFTAVEGTGHFPYILPGSTQVDTSGTSGGNGYSIEMVGEEPDGVNYSTSEAEQHPTYPFATFTASVGSMSATLDGSSTGIAGIKLSGVYIDDTILISFDADKTVGISIEERSALTTSATAVGSVVQGTNSIEYTLTKNAPYLTFKVFSIVGMFDLTNISVQKLIPYENTPLLECYRGATDGVELWGGGDWTPTGSYTSSAIYGVPTISSGDRGLFVFTVVGADISLHFRFGGAFDPTGYTTYSPGTYSVPITSDGTVPNSIALQCGSVWTGASVTDISVQKLDPQPMTTVALVKMGVGSGDLTITSNFASVGDTITSILYGQSGNQIAKAYDKTKAAYIAQAWDAGEYHLKLVQVSADGLTFRVGNKRYTSEGVGIDTDIVWSSWVAYDGSFDPLTHTRFGYGITVPIGLKQFQQWNKAATDEEILELVERSL